MEHPFDYLINVKYSIKWNSKDVNQVFNFTLRSPNCLLNCVQIAPLGASDLDLYSVVRNICPIFRVNMLLSCQPRVTLTSCFVYKVIRDL